MAAKRTEFAPESVNKIRQRARENLRRYNSKTNVEQFIANLWENASPAEFKKLHLLEESVVSILSGRSGAKGIKIDPNRVYSRRDLLAMGMPRRMVNSLSSASIQRGQYLGSAVMAALESRASALRKSRERVQFNGRMNHGRR